MLVALPEPPLVGLSVDRHQRLPDLGEDPHRGAAATDVGAGPPVGPDRPSQQQPVRDVGPRLLGADERRVALRHVDHALDHRSAAAGPHQAGVARIPRSSPRPETTMVLPAPVSPVTTLRPGLSSRTASSMTPTPWIRTSSNTPQH